MESSAAFESAVLHVHGTADVVEWLSRRGGGQRHRKERTMTESSAAHELVEGTAKGIARETTTDIRDRIEKPADRFKSEAADRVEGVADQIRQLGRQLDRRDEAHAVARRLERTADYLRYRPSGDVVADAWQTVKRSNLLWIGGGLVAGVIGYRLIRAGMRRS
jgi:hypothetical protein